MAPKLTFVNITTPSELDSRLVRKQIRANASAFSWTKRGVRPRLELGRGQRIEDITTDENEDGATHDHIVPTIDTRYLVQSWIDPFYEYPVPFQPWMPWMLDYFAKTFVPQGWRAMNVRPDEGEKWMNNTLRLCMTEPAYFYVQLFSATGSLAEQGRISPDLPLWLRGETVKALNEALNDPKRALSNPVIMTVGRVALHETVYGDRDTARLVHRPAYRWMLNARGGIRAMGLPELTVQLMDWGDRVMTALLGPPDDNGYLLLDGDQRFEPEVVNEYKPGTVKLLNGGT